MKRLLTLILVPLLLLASIVPCFATSYFSSTWTTYSQNYNTYREFVKGSAEPGEWYLSDDYFYPYENFVSIGELSCVVQYKSVYYTVSDSRNQPSVYLYRLRDANGFEFWLSCHYKGSPPTSFAEEYHTDHLGKIDPPDNVSSRYIRINNAYYYYGSEGNLQSIEFVDPEKCSTSFKIGASALCDYPIDQQSTLLSRLLNPETAYNAVDEFYKCIEHGPAFSVYRFFTPPWMLPIFIWGGVIVLAGAAAATEIVIRRKKRKAVVVDAPIEEKTA
jgi:hypothetical protein